jgi:hypothetical protein
MFLIIVLGLLFLVGVSLFVAVVGTSLLKRHAVRMPGPSERIQPEGDYGRQFAAGFQEQVAEAEKEAPASVQQPSPGAFRPSLPPFPQRAATRASGRWIPVVVIVVVVLASLMLYGTRAMWLETRGYKLYVCEGVDFTKLRPVHPSNEFTRGNVTLFLKAKEPLGIKKARVVVYRLDTQQVQPYASKTLPLRPEWTAFSTKVLFNTIGTFSVNVYGSDDVLLAQKNIAIVPDSLVYKPVPAPAAPTTQ